MINVLLSGCRSSLPGQQWVIQKDKVTKGFENGGVSEKEIFGSQTARDLSCERQEGLHALL